MILKETNRYYTPIQENARSRTRPWNPVSWTLDLGPYPPKPPSEVRPQTVGGVRPVHCRGAEGGRDGRSARARALESLGPAPVGVRRKGRALASIDGKVTMATWRLPRVRGMRTTAFSVVPGPAVGTRSERCREAPTFASSRARWAAGSRETSGRGSGNGSGRQQALTAPTSPPTAPPLEGKSSWRRSQSHPRWKPVPKR